nr:MAG TPA: DNA packaging protein [Caudoviricetes sp.]DAW25880.1 MAG TPA: DNA packaging protein [Caudoviricetes sp.]
MARALKISQQRVSQMVQQGVIPVDDNGDILLVEGIKAYCRMKKQAAEDEEVDFDKERAKHEKAKREIAELKLDEMKKNAYSAKVVEYVMTEMASNLRTQLLGLPSKLAPVLEGKTKEEIYTTTTREIEEKLSELASYTPDLFDEEIEDGEDEEDEVG